MVEVKEKIVWECTCSKCGCQLEGKLKQNSLAEGTCPECGEASWLVHSLNINEKPRYFDIVRDRKLIADGTHFFCLACVVARPLAVQSPDPRFCNGCYESLSYDAKLLTERGYTRRPWWWPSIDKPLEKVAENAKIPVPLHPLIMSTVNGTKNTVDIIIPTTTKRGPKFTDLPDDFIKQLASQGMGSKGIAAELAKKGITVSYKTVQRRLQGVLV